MSSTHDNWNKLVGLTGSGGCSLNSSMSKKRIGLKTGGSTRSKCADGGMPKKELFGKSAKRVGTMIESAKKEKMMADGGSTKDQGHVYKIGFASKNGGFKGMKLGENGAGRLKPRQEASIGGDIKNVAMKAKAGAEDVGRKIKGGFEDFGGRFKKAFHLKDGGSTGCKKKK